MNTNIANSIAHKMLEKGFLDEVGYSLQDLFKIRDCLNILNSYGLGDLDLLAETNKYIKQKAGLR